METHLTENDFLDFLKQMNAEPFLSTWLEEWELFKKDKLKEEKVTVSNFTHFTDYRTGEHGYHFKVGTELKEDIFPAICKAIELIVNGSDSIDIDSIIYKPLDKTMIRDGKGNKLYYTQEDMRQCDINAYWRGMDMKREGCPRARIYEFEEFINELNK